LVGSDGEITLRKLLATLMIGCYFAVLFYLTLFHTNRRVSSGNALNLVPFRTIAHYFREGGWVMLVNVPGNVLAFVPVGLILPVVRGRRTSVWEILLAGAGLSIFIETAQYVSGRRFADVDDVVLNALGAVIGYLVFVAFKHARRVFAPKVAHASG